MRDGPRAAVVVTTVLAAAWVAALAWVALSRIGHPFELEWMGGAFVDHVCRVLDGERIYVAPTADFVPFLYAPLYFYVSAGASLLTGEGFVPLRIVSLTSTALTLVLLWAWIARRTGSRPAGTVALGIYAGCYFLVDTWYDTARADSLFVLATLGALVVLDLGRSVRSAVWAGVLLVVAYHTKQTALLLAPPFAIAAAIRAPRRGAVFAATFVLLFGVTFALLDWLCDGWFSFYTWTLPRRHGYDWSIASDALRVDLVPLWPVLGVGAWLAIARVRAGTARDLLADGAWAGGLLLAALSSRAHEGGAVNVLMPGLLALAAIGGLASGEAHCRPVAGRVVGWVLVAQLALLAVDYGNRDDRHPARLVDPSRYLPTAADREGGERLVAMLREAPGDVLVPLHGYLPRMAGKRGGAHAMALIDVERSGEPELWDRLEVDFLESARARRAGLVLLDPLPAEEQKPPERRLARLVFPGYRTEPIAWPDADAAQRADARRIFEPVVGLKTRPIYAAYRLD